MSSSHDSEAAAGGGARRRWLRRSAVVLGALVALAAVAFGAAVALSPRLRVALRWTPGFRPHPADVRVHHEPGAEPLAAEIAAALPDAVAAVERGHGLPFQEPFRVYVPATLASFAGRLGESPSTRVRGFAMARDVWISPRAWDFAGRDTHRESLAHELSHLHVAQHLGKWRQLRDVPTWFSEGLADLVSGTGTEVVSRAEARRAILTGPVLVPDATGRLPRPRTPPEYGLSHPMLHAQSVVFLEHLVERDEASFDRLVVDVLSGEAFAVAFRRHLGQDLDAAWAEFVRTLEAPSG